MLGTIVSSQEQNSPKILIIDDAPENRLLLASQLRREQFQILSVGSGDEGIDYAKRYQPDLILLDIMLPGMSGFEVCRILKGDAATHNIPIIIITSLRDVTYRIQGIEAGADEFISRPHHREELLVRVRGLVQLKKAHERLEAERNHLQLLHDVSQATLRHIDLHDVISEIIEYTQRVLGATKGSILLTNEDGTVSHKYLARAASGISMGGPMNARVMQEGFAGWLWRGGSAGGIIHDTREDERWVPIDNDPEPVGSAVGVPLLQPDNVVLGLIILTHPEAQYFKPSHLSLLQTIAGQVVAALRNARLYDKVTGERRKLEAILGQSNDAIVTADEEQRIVLFNNTAEEIFDVRAIDVCGRRIIDVPELQSLNDLFDQIGEEPIGQDYVLDENAILYASVSRVEGAGYIAVLQDVTERIRMERRERDELRELFGRYVSPSMLKHIMSESENIFERRKHWAVIMFADLRKYTEMVGNLPAGEALDVLNYIFDALIEVIYKYDGTVLDLIGDELEIGFNVPLAQPDAAMRALETAIAMQKRFDALQKRFVKQVGTCIGLGIGIDCGEIVVGNIGSKRRMNLALVGESVNLAHRLVDLAEDGQIVVSADFYQRINALNPIPFKSLGKMPLKGLRDSVEVFQARIKRKPTVTEAV